MAILQLSAQERKRSCKLCNFNQHIQLFHNFSKAPSHNRKTRSIKSSRIFIHEACKSSPVHQKLIFIRHSRPYQDFCKNRVGHFVALSSRAGREMYLVWSCGFLYASMQRLLRTRCEYVLYYYV